MRVGVVLGVLLPSSLLAQDPVEATVVRGMAVVREFDLSTGQVRPPMEPVSQLRKLSLEVPGISAPAGSSDAWFGALDAGGREVAVIVEKEGEDWVLLVDRNADGRLEDGEKFTLEMDPEPSRSLFLFWGLGGSGSDPVSVTLTIDGRGVPGLLGFTEDGRKNLLGLPGDGIPGVAFRSLAYMEAFVEVGDETQTLLVLDEDLDGRFGSSGDAWTLARPGDQPARIYQLNAMEASSFRDGQRFSVKVADEAVEVTVSRAEGPDRVSQAVNRERVERIWFERFDLDREAFVVERGVDTSRPRSEVPIEWNYVSFDQGVALAAESDKLLFADVRRFLMVWSYWLDYYTYPDDEVAALMKERFVPVKIIQEQDHAGDYRRVLDLLVDRSDPAWRSRYDPAMAIFDGEGKLVHKIDLQGVMPAQALVEHLKAAISKR